MRGEMSEKTEKPTAKKIRDARKKGLVAISRDLNAAILLSTSMIIIFVSISFVAKSLKKMAEKCLLMISSEITEFYIIDLLKEGFKFLLIILIPFVLIISISIVFLFILQAGFRFNLSNLSIRMERIDFIAGIRRIISLKSLVESIKSAMKALVCSLVFIIILKKYIREIILSVDLVPSSIGMLIEKLSSGIVVKILIVFFAIAVVDVLYQRWDYLKGLRMSKEEVRQEFKQEEGDPIIRSKRKQLYEEIAVRDITKDIAKADVVIVNPCTVAVALCYEQHKMNAPVVLAKGIKQMAQRIKEIARQHNIPIIEDKELAHKLIRINVGDEIPENLYEQVAKIYQIIYELMEKI